MAEGFHSIEARASAARALADLDTIMTHLAGIALECNRLRTVHDGLEGNDIRDTFAVLTGGLADTLSDADVTVSDLRDRLRRDDYYAAPVDYKALMKAITAAAFPGSDGEP